MPCDYKRYPKDWRAIRAEVLERAGHKCEGCGVRNYAIMFDDLRGIRVEHDGSHADDLFCEEFNRKCVKVVLTISHTDHDISNNGEPGNRPNLRALCQRCHLRHDIHIHRANASKTRKRKAGLRDLFAE